MDFENILIAFGHLIQNQKDIHVGFSTCYKRLITSLKAAFDFTSWKQSYQTQPII
jgi:hypothetical protein